VLDTPRLPRRSADIEVIFEQARRRRTRRRLLGVAVASLMAGTMAAVGLTVGSGSHDPAARGGAEGRPAAAAKPVTGGPARPAARLAWIDSAGELNIGDPAAGVQQAGPLIDASPSAALVVAGGQLYWSDSNRNIAPIRAYDLATGKIRYLAAGEATFASADGRHLYIVRNDSTLMELPADGAGPAAVLRVPAGWHVAGHSYQWFPWEGTVAGGIIVYSADDQNYVPASAREGIWNPSTGLVRVLGRGIQITSAYTPPGAPYSLLDWVKPSIRVTQDFTLRITNTATLATVTVRSPLHHGFAFSGAPAFSPDGTQMAVFARTAALGSASGMSELAIVDTSTGSVRLVPGTAVFTTEDAYWALWLPGSEQVLAGATTSGYAVDARTLAARQFSFFPSEYGFSAVVLPGRQSRS
jgi:WD40-like Beta Propeller Repeat